jgi:hypothetical protein
MICYLYITCIIMYTHICDYYICIVYIVSDMPIVIIIIASTCKHLFIYYLSFSGQSLSWFLRVHVFLNNYALLNSFQEVWNIDPSDDGIHAYMLSSSL